MVLLFVGFVYFNDPVCWWRPRGSFQGEDEDRRKRKFGRTARRRQRTRNNISGYPKRSWFLTSGSMDQNIQLKAATSTGWQGVEAKPILCKTEIKQSKRSHFPERARGRGMELAQHRELIARIRVGRVSLGMWPLGALCHALAIGTVDGGRLGEGRGQ